MNITELDAIVFDFDGVLTDNRVYVDQDGKESVCCNRSDGLAFDVLRKLEIPVYILSTESNPVVGIRAKKLKVPVLQGVSNKLETLTQICSERSYDLRRILFIGNDLNDFSVMKNSGFSACPSDSHPEIKKISQFKLKAKGGNGVAREILEEIFKLDFLKYL